MVTEPNESTSLFSVVIYVLGVLAIILGFLLLISIWFFYIGGPLFLVGVILVWISGVSRRIKAVTSFISFGAIVLTFFVYRGTLSVRDSNVIPVTYLIPVDFRGTVTIVSSQACGARREENGGAITYQIPTNGVLIVQEEMVTETRREEFYLVDVHGIRVKQLYHDEWPGDESENHSDENSEKRLVVSYGSNSGLTKDQPNKEEFVESQVFNVIREDSANVQLPYDTHLVDSLIIACKRKNGK